MKILFLTSAFPSSDHPKSNAHNLRSVLNLSTAPTLEIQVVHLRSWRPWRKIFVKTQLHGMEVWSYSFPFYPRLPKLLLGMLLIIYKKTLYHFFLKKNMQNVDVIHTAGVAMESVVGAYISKKTGLKHVAQSMGGDVNFDLPRLSRTPGWLGFEKHVNVFCCNSISLQKQLKKIYPSAKSEVIYRGVNLDEFDYEPLSESPGNTFTFLYLGGLVTDAKHDQYNSKGGVTLLEAWLMLINSIGIEKDNVELIFCGPHVNNDVIAEILGQSPGSVSIKVVGQVSIHGVKHYIAQSDVIIVPSLTEGLPNVAMEAAAIGRPVIGSEVGGIPEIVINGETGFLFQADNVKELCDLIKFYIKNPEQMQTHGLNARKHVVKNFNSKSFTENYMKLYKNFKSKISL